MKSFLRSIPAGTATIILLGIITYLSLADRPFGDTHISLFRGADKLVHILMYLVLDVVVLLDYTKHRYPHHTNDNISLAFTACVSLYGLLMELAQLMMQETSRSYDIVDWYADTFGAVLGFFLARLWVCRWYRHHIISHHHHHHHDKESE